MGRVPRELFVPEARARGAPTTTPRCRSAPGRRSRSRTWSPGSARRSRCAGDERVLDVGTGSGYQAAVLAELAAEVVTVERIPELAEQARGEPRRGRLRARRGARRRRHARRPGARAVRRRSPSPRPRRSCRRRSTSSSSRAAGSSSRSAAAAARAGGDRRTPRGPGRARASVPCRFVPLVGEQGFESSPLSSESAPDRTASHGSCSPPSCCACRCACTTSARAAGRRLLDREAGRASGSTSSAATTSHRFLPLGGRAVRADEIAVASALTLLDEDELRSTGARLDAALAARRGRSRRRAARPRRRGTGRRCAGSRDRAEVGAPTASSCGLGARRRSASRGAAASCRVATLPTLPRVAARAPAARCGARKLGPAREVLRRRRGRLRHQPRRLRAAARRRGVHYLLAAACSFLVAVDEQLLRGTASGRSAAQRGHFAYQGLRFLVVSLRRARRRTFVLLALLVGSGSGKIAAQAIAIVLVTPLNFVGNKLWSFRRR